jgi:hypothetical protein
MALAPAWSSDEHFRTRPSQSFQSKFAGAGVPVGPRSQSEARCRCIHPDATRVTQKPEKFSCSKIAICQRNRCLKEKIVDCLSDGASGELDLAELDREDSDTPGTMDLDADEWEVTKRHVDD